ncbi:MAG: branched-chain amino acid ABC transporter ATP-binding protein [Proteobacteria bacterium]|nr:MAG: branched-chain amino acid ABC transporter ATP-binding protein [Pseudomonadota bacterium]
MEALLSLEGARSGYGKIEVLKGLSLKVYPGEIVSVIGANGAGKTTTLMSISRIVPLRSGNLNFDGVDLRELKAHELVERGLAHVPEGRRIFTRMTVRENLDLGAFLRSDARGIARDMQHVFELFPVLKERQTQSAGTLSGGEQQMLAIGRALMSRPKMLLLDEPSMGVAPILVGKIFETLLKLNQEGTTILLVEQNARLALKISKRGYVLERGEIVMEDEAAKLLANPKIQEAYLGEGH